jgi:ATP-dependent Clp protease protease subunit
VSVWPPVPPDPPHPLRTPWHPEPAAPRPAAPPSSPGWSLIAGTEPDWLTERLVGRRLVALAGELDRDAANRVVSELALLDASGDEPVTLRLTGLSADLDSALTVVDALDMMGVEVHATCLGTITGAAVAILAVAGRRIAGLHATVQLREPRSRHHVAGPDLEAHAEQHQRQLRGLQERIATACHRPVDTVIEDMRAGRLLTAEQARDYGLIDSLADRAARPPSGDGAGRSAGDSAATTDIPPTRLDP